MLDKMTAEIEKLPNEILQIIYHYLNFADLLLFAQVNSKMHRSVFQPTVFEKTICLIGNGGFQRSNRNSFNHPRLKRLVINDNVTARLKSALNCVRIVSTRGWCDLNGAQAGLLFPKFKNLTHLDLLGNQKVDDDVVRLVLTHCKKLSHLNVSHCSRLTQKTAFLICSNPAELEGLNLSSTACVTNKSWAVICATLSEQLSSLSVSSCYSSVSFDIMRSYPRNATFLDFSRNDTMDFGFLESICNDRQNRRKPPLLTIDIRDCDAITVDEVCILESIPGSFVRFLSNPKLQNNNVDGIRSYLNRLIAL